MGENYNANLFNYYYDMMVQVFYYYINTHIAVVQGLAEGLENQSLISNTHITVVVVRKLVSAVTIVCFVCADERLCPADQFECYESRSSGADRCIHGNWQCDGDSDCPHGEDERYCNSECSWQHSHNPFNRCTSSHSLLAFEHTVTLDIAGFWLVCMCACAHSEHHFPAPSSKLCQIWLRHWRGTLYLRAAVHRHGQCPPKGLGTDKTVEAT